MARSKNRRIGTHAFVRSSLRYDELRNMSSCPLRLTVVFSVALTFFPIMWILSCTQDHSGRPLDHSGVRVEQSLQWVSQNPANETRRSMPDFVLGTTDARDADGSLGYVADPSLLKTGVMNSLKMLCSRVGHLCGYENLYLPLLQEHERTRTRILGPGAQHFGNATLSPELVCGFGPGQGIEEPPGYKLMTEKLRVSREVVDSPKVFCGIYTYSAKINLVRAQALSWGFECDGFLAFSNETIPTLGVVDLVHEGGEHYQNMWRKVVAIWQYIYAHYLDKYDYFHLGGDDMYVIIQNLRRFLARGDLPSHQPLHMGQWLPNKNMISGGPGYTLNAKALRVLVEKGLPYWKTNALSSAEDRLISGCLQSLGVFGNVGDTRDLNTGEQQYHDDHPSSLYSFRSSGSKRASYTAKNAHSWEKLPHPSQNTTLVGSRHELSAAAIYSVSFHHLHTPQHVARFHAILRPGVCPQDSPLGKGLRSHRSLNV